MYYEISLVIGYVLINGDANFAKNNSHDIKYFLQNKIPWTYKQTDYADYCFRCSG